MNVQEIDKAFRAAFNASQIELIKSVIRGGKIGDTDYEFNGQPHSANVYEVIGGDAECEAAEQLRSYLDSDEDAAELIGVTCRGPRIVLLANLNEFGSEGANGALEEWASQE